MFSELALTIALQVLQPSRNIPLTLMPEYAVTQAFFKKDPPRRTTDSIGPVLQAKAVYAADAETGIPFYTNNVFKRYKIASISKLVTAMVILDKHQLDEVLTVSKNAADQEGSQMGLVTGEKITVGDALTGLLIPSGNDAAVALAEFSSGTEVDFVKEMNQKAISLGLQNTHFSNAKGFDDNKNYASAFDVFLFGQAASRYPFIRNTVHNKEARILSSDKEFTHEVSSTNKLLGNKYFDVIGLKTGSTPEAGESFVSLTRMNGRDVIVVVLNSPDRFRETEIVLDWIQRTFVF